MSTDLRFAYANARLKGMKSNLLHAEVVRKMIDVPSVTDVVELLEEQAPYKPDFVTASQQYQGIELVEKALHSHQLRILRKVLLVTPPHARDALASFYLEFEVQDLKNIASRLALGLPVEKQEWFGLETSRGLLSRAAMSKDLDGLVRSLAFEPAYVTQMLPLEERNGRRKPLALKDVLDALDRTQLQRLRNLSQTLDDPYARRILAARLQYLTAMIILRLRKFGANADEVRRHTTPAGRDKFLAQLAAESSYGKALAFVAKHYALDEAVLKKAEARNSLVPVEIALEKKYVEETLRHSRLASLSLAAMIGFLLLKNTEIGNIRKIALAKHFAAEEEIRDIVFAIHA